MKQIYYGTILTMEQAQPQARAVLVEDGVIQAVGGEEILSLRDHGTELTDLGEAAMLPAFIDPHSHILSYARTLGMVPLQKAGSLPELVERMRASGRGDGGGPEDWLIGFGYDHNLLEEGRHPTRTELDQVSGCRPVMVTHASGHMGAVNTRGLELLGIGRDTPDPQGGRIGREADGAPDGYLEENAFLQWAAQMPKPGPEAVARRMEQAQRDYLSYGITTVQEGLVREEELRVLSGFAQDGKLAVNLVGYLDFNQLGGLLKGRPELRQSHGRLRMGGYKIFLDGSPQGKTAWITRPYEGGTDGCGYPALTDAQVEQYVRRAAEEGVQLLAHCNGDAAAEQFLSACERVQAAGLRVEQIRPVMIHAQLVRPDQLKRMAAVGMIPSFFVAHTYYWGDVHLKNLGLQRGGQISPAGSAMREGLRFTFHQDTPVVEPDMLRTVWCAVNRRTREGVVLDAAERIPVLEALRAVTLYAAYQYCEEDVRGSIRPGKLADFVVLDRNPLEASPRRLDSIRVLRTIREGETLYQA